MKMNHHQLLKPTTLKNRHIPVLLWWILAISSAVRFFFIWYFGDVDFEPDSYAHFLYAVSSFTHLPGSLNFSVGVWQKPLYTLATGFIIWITGIKLLWIIKVFNTIIWGIISFLTYLIARRLQLSEKAGLVAAFLVGFSFLGFRSSISVLTEPLFTLMIVAALLALFNKRYTISCVLVSLSVLTRSEGLLLVGGWVLVLWLVDRRRNVSDLVALVFFPFCWNIWGYSITKDITFIFTSGYSLGSIYGQGGWLYYFVGLLQYEPLIFPLALLGLALSLRNKRYTALHILVVIFFAFNIIAWRFGKFSTAGLLRYFVPVIPWLAIYAAGAVESTGLLLSVNRQVKYAFQFLLIVQSIFTISVLNSHTEGYHLYNTPFIGKAIVEAGEWIKAHPVAQQLYISHPAILYYAGRDFSTGGYLKPLPNSRQMGLVSYDCEFSSPELWDYMANFEPLKSFGDCVYLYNYDLTPVLVPAQLSFGDQAIAPFLKSGWSNIENWGVWALGNQAELNIFVPAAQDLTVKIEAFPQPNSNRQQKVKFMYNNTFVGEYQFPMGNTAPQKISFKIPAKLVTGRLDRIKFLFDYAVSPAEQGINNDARQLAVGFLNMNITPAE